MIKLSIKIDELSYDKTLFKDLNYEFEGPNLYIIEGRNGSGKEITIGYLPEEDKIITIDY